jgi:hypothetical protein
LPKAASEKVFCSCPLTAAGRTFSGVGADVGFPFLSSKKISIKSHEGAKLMKFRFVAIAAILLAPLAVEAHHSFVEFNRDVY